MAYNKAKAEQEWLRWKEAEEEQLRSLDVDEDMIQRLHRYDWEAFKKDRLYHMRWAEWTPQIEQFSARQIEIAAEDVQSLLDNIGNPSLLQLLLKADSITQKILFGKVLKYTNAELARIFNMTEAAVEKRFERFRQEICEFFENNQKRCRLFAFFLGYIVKAKTFLRILTTEYQFCRYLPVQTSDIGKSAKMTWHSCVGAISFDRKEARHAFSPRLWAGYNDTQYRPPPRQRG